MYRTIKSLAAAAAIALVTACGDAASPTESTFMPPEAPLAAKPPTGSTGQLTFSYTQSQSDEQAQSALGGLGRINFTGSLLTGTPCVNVTATHTAGSGVVNLNVTSAPNGSACIQVITYNNYQGNISGLPAGTYTFNAVHNGTVAYTTTVTVL
ncbi:MAG TPA: hypothetical protein VFR81_02225 [Longimicrobium sp.]|nr:hypothetical protein [Longimicrobium sp.]